MTDAPPKHSENDSTLNGLRKAAILLLSMDSETSAKVVQLLPRHSVEEVTREIASIDLVNPDTSITELACVGPGCGDSSSKAVTRP